MEEIDDCKRNKEWKAKKRKATEEEKEKKIKGPEESKEWNRREEKEEIKKDSGTKGV